MQTGIYVRVSTEEQAREGFSIRAQQEKLREYSKLMDWSVYKIYTDEGISGKNITGRPSLVELIGDIKKGKVKNVLVYKVDRLTRSTRDLIELVELFDTYDVAFNSFMESIDTQSPSGRMFLKIIGIFAEFERENISERTRLGFEKKTREGYSGSRPIAPYGYSRDMGQKVQTIHGEEAAIVKEIFDMYLNRNMSFYGIACELNVRKVVTKCKKTWSAHYIKQVLTNPVYIGKVRYCIQDTSRYFEADGRHEALIPEETFYAVRDKMKKIGTKTPTKWPKTDHYFCGVLVCAICGRKLTTHIQYKTRKDGSQYSIAQYVCTNRIHKACTAKIMSHKKVEEAFEKYIRGVADFDVADVVPIPDSPTVAENAGIIAEYEDSIEKLGKKEREVMTLYLSNILCYDEYATMIKMIGVQKSTLEKKLAEHRAKTEEETVIVKREDVIVSIRENWDLLSNGERLQFLQTYIERIVIINQAQEGTQNGIVRIERVDFYTH